MAPLVDSPTVASASLHTPLPFFLHYYIAPFSIIWPVFLSVFLTPSLYQKHIGAPEWTFVWCGTIITAQSLVWLCTHWNVNLKSMFTSVKATTVQNATLIKVLPVANAGAADICTIDRDNVSTISLYCVHLLIVLGRGQRQYFLPLPKTPVSIQSRQELLQTTRVCHRCRAKASHRSVPEIPWNNHSSRALANPAALWR